MYKKQLFLVKWSYMINDKEHEAKNENRSHRYDINRSGHKHMKHKIRLSIMMGLCIKQHLRNIGSLIYENFNQLWGWVEKKTLLTKRQRVILLRYSSTDCVLFLSSLLLYSI